MRLNQEPYINDEHQKSPLALRRSVDALISLSRPIKSISVEGESNLQELSPNVPVIIAVSHKSGLDIPLAIKALGERFDIAVVSQSTHHSLNSEINMYLSLKLAGDKNFIPISYEWEDGQKVPSMFNPNDALPIVDALARGKSIVIASHNPLIADERGEVKNPKPGYSAAYVALLTGAPVIPVAINMIPTDMIGRFDAVVNIGKPFTPGQQVGIDELQSLSIKRKMGGKLTTDEIGTLHEQLKDLRSTGQTIFDTVVSLEVFPNSFPMPDKKQKMGSVAMKAGRSFIGPIC